MTRPAFLASICPRSFALLGVFTFMHIADRAPFWVAFLAAVFVAIFWQIANRMEETR